MLLIWAAMGSGVSSPSAREGPGSSTWCVQKCEDTTPSCACVGVKPLSPAAVVYGSQGESPEVTTVVVDDPRNRPIAAAELTNYSMADDAVLATQAPHHVSIAAGGHTVRRFDVMGLDDTALSQPLSPDGITLADGGPSTGGGSSGTAHKETRSRHSVGSTIVKTPSSTRQYVRSQSGLRWAPDVGPLGRRYSSDGPSQQGSARVLGAECQTPHSVIRDTSSVGLPSHLSSDQNLGRLRRNASGLAIGPHRSDMSSPSGYDSGESISENDEGILRDPPEFEVTFEDRQLPLGARVLNASSKALLITEIFPDGALARWNAEHPEARVVPGDNIMEISGIGRGAVEAFQVFFSEEMTEMLSSEEALDAPPRRMMLRHDAFDLALGRLKGDSTPLGVVLEIIDSEKLLRVLEVVEGGLVSQWNTDAAVHNLSLVPGDVILQVNGVNGSAKSMLEAIDRSQFAWEFTAVHVQRFQNDIQYFTSLGNDSSMSSSGSMQLVQ
mmetsp:Transcript_50016/g.118997  ORF Transcript_50016/g.118997 Transcript_50016/m.118997 type:complete len:496 (-) Transcript_50016:41-1528(-)